jgi:actin-related protein
VYVGHDVTRKRGLLGINRPLENGYVNNWEDMELIWKHIYNDKINVVPQDYPCLITESNP